MNNVSEKARSIQLLILDVDGVMTDGTLYFGPAGAEYKAFNIKDGQGLRMLQEAGVEIAVITGRESDAVTRRMHDLKIQYVYQGQQTKLDAYHELLNKLELQPVQVAYMGDDILDIPVMQEVGLAICVEDAHPSVIEICDWQTCNPGGHGAVREVSDFILNTKELLEKTIESLINPI